MLELFDRLFQQLIVLLTDQLYFCKNKRELVTAGCNARKSWYYINKWAPSRIISHTCTNWKHWHWKFSVTADAWCYHLALYTPGRMGGEYPSVSCLCIFLFWSVAHNGVFVRNLASRLSTLPCKHIFFTKVEFYFLHNRREIF